MAGIGPPGERVKLNNNSLKAVDAYWEYTRYTRSFNMMLKVKLLF
jgi:hypothetical protein